MSFADLGVSRHEAKTSWRNLRSRIALVPGGQGADQNFSEYVTATVKNDTYIPVLMYHYRY